jgi:Tol biopolymer transport system component
VGTRGQATRPPRHLLQRHAGQGPSDLRPVAERPRQGHHQRRLRDSRHCLVSFRQMARDRHGPEAWRLAVVNVSSGKTRLVTGYYGDDPAWSPDGQWICFLYGTGPIRDGEPRWRGLAVVRPNGRGFKKVAVGSERAWSPDSKKISFARFNANGDGLGIWVIDADGFHPRRLTARASDGEPAWSPIGSQIVFTRSGGDFGSTSGSCDRTGVTRPA